MPDKRTYWFRAKEYGWGWGLPLTWQGWVVFAAFFLLVISGALVLLPKYGPAVFLPYTVLLVLILIGVCWLTGEPPRWRWGKK